VLPRAERDADASDARRRRNTEKDTDGGSGRDTIDDGFSLVNGNSGGVSLADGRESFAFQPISGRGGVLSALDGIPIAVKDNFCIVGASTTAGSKMLRGFSPPTMESTVTARLSAAGGVLFCKTNMDEFGMGSANINSAYGACINPWMARPRTAVQSSATGSQAEKDGEGYPLGYTSSTGSQSENFAEEARGARVVGGSSGGSAAAVASGVAIAAVGSDTGGSVRLPAAYAGLVGLKPSYGRLSRWGLVPYCSSLDCPGFLTRTVADAAAMLHATQGIDPLDATTIVADARLERLLISMGMDVDDSNRDTVYLKSKPGFPLWGWRVGIPQEYNVAELSEEVRIAWSSAAAACEALGATVVPVSLPHTGPALAAYYVLAPAESSSNLARYDGIRFGTHAGGATTRQRPQCGGDGSGGVGGNTKGEGGEKRGSGEEAAAAAAGEAIQKTGVVGDAFHTAVATARTAGFGPEVQRRILVGTHVMSTDLTARYLEKAQRVRRLVAGDFARVFSGTGGGGAGGRGSGSGSGASGHILDTGRGVDILLTPTAPTCAPLLHSPECAAVTAGYAADVMTVPASLAGLPAMSLPVGLGRDSGGDSGSGFRV